MSSTTDVSQNIIEKSEEESSTSASVSTPTWNKLNKITKKNKLYEYAEKYVENKYNASDLKMLKMFF